MNPNLQTYFIYVVNAVILGAVLTFVYLGKITWSEAMAAIGLLLTPSATHVMGAK